MVPFRRFTLIFFIILLILNFWTIILSKSAGGVLHNHTTLLYALLFCLYFGISFGMAFLPCTNFHHPVICRGNSDKKSVSITFDDGPHPVKTPLILEVLKKNQIQATFFCIGNKLAGNETLVKKINDDGHLIGNHSFSHSKWFDLFPGMKIRSELQETDRLIQNITGRIPLFFRPPFGVVNPMVSNALKNMHWQAVCWNIRSLDTISTDPQKIRQKILRKLKPGSIILLHDYTFFTEHYLEILVSEIRDAGYCIVPLDQLLNQPAYASLSS